MEFCGGGNDSPSPVPEPLPPGAPNMTAGPAKPIRLVYCDENGGFQLDPEAVAVLQLVEEPVGVVSVCGPALQGKSFILNQLLGKCEGFQVAPALEPCTKGIWLWGAPLKRTAPDGAGYSLLLLDTEGIDTYDNNGTYNTQILSLTVLLSSMFIYNQMGGINEAALDHLSLVTKMTKHICDGASSRRFRASELGQFPPVLTLLLRDFYLDLVEDDMKIPPCEYLQRALESVQGGAKNLTAENEIRESIRAFFPCRECFTLVRPLFNEQDLPRLDQIALEELRPEFRSGLDSFCRFVLEKTQVKQVGTKTVTGPIFARIIQSFLDALNKGAVPTITRQSARYIGLRSSDETNTSGLLGPLERFQKSHGRLKNLGCCTFPIGVACGVAICCALLFCTSKTRKDIQHLVKGCVEAVQTWTNKGCPPMINVQDFHLAKEFNWFRR